MSVGKFCAKGDHRYTTFTTNGGILWHEEAGEIAINKVRNHYELEGWIKPVNVSTKVQIGDPSGIIGEPEGHHVAVPQQTDDEIPMRLCSRGAYIPKGTEEYIEPEILPVA